jgi:hypothetical protein
MIEYFEIPGVGGVATGLLVPAWRVTTCSQYVDAGPMWTRERIEEVLSHPLRATRSQLFGDPWIRNQGNVGSCNGFAAASALERTRWLRGLPTVKLSGVGLYAAINGGQDRGSMLDDGMQWMQRQGVPPDSLVPEFEWRKSKILSEAWEEAKRFKGFECYGISSAEELASALAAGFVCVIAVHAGNGGLSPDNVVDWGNGPGNHAVCCDDLRIRGGRYEFQIANSWGLNWGERGRAWLQWDRHLSQPIRSHFFYAVRAATDDPQET